MAESAWPALLAALSYGISTNLSDTLFADVLSALSDFTIACGLLELTTPRDAFLNTLSKYAVPPPAVTAMQHYMDGPSTPRNNSVVDSLGLGVNALTGLPLASVAGPPGLSERNLACLKSMITTTTILARSLDERSWQEVLETLQNANYMLGAAGSAAARKASLGRRGTQQMLSPQIGNSPVKRKVSESAASVAGDSHAGSEGGETRPEVFDDLDVESIQSLIAVLFDGTRDLEDSALAAFVGALCRLSEEMIGTDSGWTQSQSGHGRPSVSVDHGDNIVDLTDPPMSPAPSLLSPSGDVKRRASGLNISNNLKSGDRSFSLQKLRLVATLNLARLVNSAPEIGWKPITTHLLAVARHVSAPSTLRLQASDALSELLLGAIRVGKESRTQHQVFDVLVRQVDVWPTSNNISTDYDVRSSGYQTLNSILEGSGHELEVGWVTIFDMLNNVCSSGKEKSETSASAPMRRSDSSMSISSLRPAGSTLSASKSTNLVRIAFPSLTLICTDFLSSLDTAAIRQCIACLGAFGRQKEDVNITLAAIGLLWNVSDKVQRDEANGEGSDGVWLYLLKEMLDLARDSRLEVRSSAIQTLFRCVEIYGAGQLPRPGEKEDPAGGGKWKEVWLSVISPLLDSDASGAGSSAGKLGDDSTVLALSSTGGIFHSFLPQLARLDSFDKIWARYLERIEYAWSAENRQCCNAALKSLERALGSIASAPSKRDFMLDSTWSATRRLSAMLEQNVYTQDNLSNLVNIVKLLHDALPTESIQSNEKDLSAMLRGVMIYDKSPEYRPDTDHMSPLQEALSDLTGKSDKLGLGSQISIIAEWTSLAYVAGGRCTYVGLSKWGMSWMRRHLGDSRGPWTMDGSAKAERTRGLFEDGIVESVLAAFALPIKMKYDCPAANRFGEGPPLWRVGMEGFVPVLRGVVRGLDELGEFVAVSSLWLSFVVFPSVIMFSLRSDSYRLSAHDRQAQANMQTSPHQPLTQSTPKSLTSSPRSC